MFPTPEVETSNTVIRTQKGLTSPYQGGSVCDLSGLGSSKKDRCLEDCLLEGLPCVNLCKDETVCQRTSRGISSSLWAVLYPQRVL